MLTLPSAFRRIRRNYADRPAIVDREARFTWEQFLSRVARVASVLQSLGVKAGDRYGIVGRNTFRHYELLHAGYWMGAIPVPLNNRLAPPEIKHILDDSGCRVLVVEDVFLDLFKAPEFAPWQSNIIRFASTPAVDVPDYERLVANAVPAAMHEAGEDDDAILLYTGGTTGRSKGVRLTHKNIISNGLQCIAALRMRENDTYLHIAPMFHSADLLGTGFTLLGAAHAFLPQFTPVNVLQAVQDYRVTFAMMAPTMVILTLQEPSFDRYDLSSFRRLFYGSSPMAVEWITRTLDRFAKTEVEQGYGLTETSPILTVLPVADHLNAIASGEHEVLKSCGRAVPGLDLRVVDDEGRDVATGEAGEVVVRGPNVTPGYLNLPDVNRSTFTDGWFHTGDVGKFDARGNLYLLDRKKDMVITGGENVYTSEVEAVIYQHPSVFEAAVFGVPDETYGEALFAAVVVAPGATLTAEELIAHCRGRIGGYKIPRRYAFIPAMPKSAMGKILKTELRRSYGASAQKKAS